MPSLAKKTKNSIRTLYAVKAIAKKKGNRKQWKALDRKIRKMEGKS